MPLPEKDEMFNTRGRMIQHITVSLGGRVAEELIFDDITTGASQDIKQATAIAKAMVTKFGMSSKIGLVAYGDDQDEVFIGRDLAQTRGCSEDVAKTIGEDVRPIIESCHEEARRLIAALNDLPDFLIDRLRHLFTEAFCMRQVTSDKYLILI